MNTLLGQIATYDDIAFPRYRLAFKLRRLQTSFLLHKLEMSALQDAFHSSGLHSLSIEQELSESQLSLVFEEIYSSLRATLQSALGAQTLQEAHTTCFNWFMLALQCGAPDSRGNAGALKIALALFCGGQTSEKAKYIFSVLAKDGTVGLEGLQFFCESMQLLANFLKEVLYPDVKSVDRAMSECLYLVRDQDDIDDEEEDGGLQRPWLSVFELTKSFTASPPLNFLSWLHLWFSLPTIEKVVHQVKCNICNKKTIKGFRYQCEECSNYNMCQMCFLKGRSSDQHKREHKVVECHDYTKSFKSRIGLGASAFNSKIYRQMADEPVESNLQIRLSSKDVATRSSAGSLNRLSVSLLESPVARSSSVTPEPAHRPTIIRIGSKDSDIGSPKRDSIQRETHRLSLASTSSSESYDGGRPIEGAVSPVINLTADGGSQPRKPSPIIPSISNRRFTHSGFGPIPHPSLQRIADEEITGAWQRKHSAPNTMPRSVAMTKTYSAGTVLEKREQDEFNQLNKKLSLEVDKLLSDIQPDISESKKMSVSSDESDKDLALLEELCSMDDISNTQTRLEAESQRKRQLDIELDNLLGTIDQLHTGFMGLKDGNRVSPLPHNILNTESATQGHQRTGSLDLLANTTRTNISTNGYLTLPSSGNYGNRLSIVW